MAVKWFPMEILLVKLHLAFFVSGGRRKQELVFRILSTRLSMLWSQRGLHILAHFSGFVQNGLGLVIKTLLFLRVKLAKFSWLHWKTVFFTILCVPWEWELLSGFCSVGMHRGHVPAPGRAEARFPAARSLCVLTAVSQLLVIPEPSRLASWRSDIHSGRVPVSPHCPV